MKNILIKDKSLMLEANHWNIVLVQQKSWAWNLHFSNQAP